MTQIKMIQMILVTVNATEGMEMGTTVLAVIILQTAATTATIVPMAIGMVETVTEMAMEITIRTEIRTVQTLQTAVLATPKILLQIYVKLNVISIIVCKLTC